MSVAEPPEVTVDTADGVALLTLARPDRRNAVSEAQIAALVDALEAAAGDAAVQVVVLTGSDRFFHVGGDMTRDADTTHVASEDAYRRQLRVATRVVELLHGSPKVTIAAVNGSCGGAGLAYALAADLRYAARRARFATGFLSVGLPGELGAIWFATRALGAGRAAELFLQPEKIDAEAAERIGLVNAVYDDDALLPAVLERARRLAGSAPLALRAMKANLVDAAQSSFADYLGREMERMARCGCSEDAAEGRRAFREGRLPAYRGR